MSTRAKPVGGPIVTPTFVVLASFVAVSLAILAWRFIFGIGPVTGLNDGFPWGIWIAFDVVTGTALATGGYALAILVYVLNRGRYHRLVRSAVLVSALGYTLGGISVVIDLGRWWNVWHVPTFFWSWNRTSILLEVALCIMLYTFVAWIEVAPAFLEKWQDSAHQRLGRFARGATPLLEKALPWLLALGVLLPTMHQSSLGSLMLLAGPKLHPLWHTPLLPLLFLVSCTAMGYGGVVLESLLASHAFKRRAEMDLLGRLGGVTVWILAAYLAIRIVDLLLRGRLGLVFTSGWLGVWFVLEIALFAGAIALLGNRQLRARPGSLFRAAMLMVLAGAMYRFSTFLVAFDPGVGWSYFPTVPEILVTLGLIAGEILTYTVIVKRFPILNGAASTAPAH